MRDVGILIWVAFLIIGVLGSIVSSIRKQMQRPGAAGQRQRPIPPQWQPPPGQLPVWVQQVAAQVAPPPRVVTPPVAPKPAPPRPLAVEQPHDLQPVPRRSRRLFRDRNAIVQAVIAAEVLGKPRGLSDEYL